MGFFSWECPCCNVSIRSHWATNDIDEQHCTLVLPDRIVQGAYDGYGRIDTDVGDIFDISEEVVFPLWEEDKKEGIESDMNREVKIYHTKCWRKQGMPSFEYAKWSRYADDQGFFFGENDVC